jgi:hypothetical protein
MPTSHSNGKFLKMLNEKLPDEVVSRFLTTSCEARSVPYNQSDEQDNSQWNQMLTISHAGHETTLSTMLQNFKIKYLHLSL